MSTTNTATTSLTERRKLMTPEELAEYLGVTLHCVYAWSSRGGGPRILRVGARLRYRPADVETWLDSVADDERQAS